MVAASASEILHGSVNRWKLCGHYSGIPQRVVRISVGRTPPQVAKCLFWPQEPRFFETGRFKWPISELRSSLKSYRRRRRRRVTSPKGLHGWKHRFAVKLPAFAPICGAGRHPAVEIWKHRFARSSNWKHTFAIRLCSWIGKPKKSNVQAALPAAAARRPRQFCPVLQSYGSNFANLWVK
jgi:hypothetical protein